MTSFDYAILLIIGFSVLLSVIRGAVREIVALSAWFISFWFARNFTEELAPLLPESIPSPELRLLSGFVALFLGSLLIMTLLSIALSEVIKALGLSGFDRMLGAVIGLLRGSFIVLVLVLLAGLTGLPQTQTWKNAMFSPVLEASALAVRPWLPDEFARHIRYE